MEQEWKERYNVSVGQIACNLVALASHLPLPPCSPPALHHPRPPRPSRRPLSRHPQPLEPAYFESGFRKPRILGGLQTLMLCLKAYFVSAHI